MTKLKPLKVGDRVRVKDGVPLPITEGYCGHVLHIVDNYSHPYHVGGVVSEYGGWYERRHLRKLPARKEGE